MINIRDRIESSRTVVENLKTAQKKQKEYYDKRAREIQLDKVLLLNGKDLTWSRKKLDP